MTDETAKHDNLISEFVHVTGASPRTARDFLSRSSYEYSSAVFEYFNAAEAADPAPQPSASSSSAPQPIPTSSPMPPPPPEPAKKKFATLGDLKEGAAPGHEGHGHDDDDEDDEDYKPDLYAGGEKSGLAVENPDTNALQNSIVERAKRMQGQARARDAPAAPSRFTGTARTLGGDDTESQIIEDPAASRPQRPEPVERRLHFWADGFSVDDGPLYEANDPQNAAILQQIKNGRAPLHILNVTHDQEVDVKLEQHKEKYTPPKKKYKAFQGGGQRLGSPTPGIESHAQVPSAQAAAPVAAASTGSSQPTMDVNENEPTISLQIRLGDGTRLVSRFNATHTIGDVYAFVNASSPSSRGRAWALMTTFPSKELQDKTQVLGDLADFKRGGVVVQKWQ